MEIDQLINERILASLKSYPFLDTTDIEVSVVDGNVTLSGSVNESSDARVILTESLLVNGVNSVEDKLEYRGSSAYDH